LETQHAIRQAHASGGLCASWRFLRGVGGGRWRRWGWWQRRARRQQFDRDADGHNWLGYSYRKSGRLNEAFVHYKRALAIDRSHLGAHEYIGEAYLMANQPDEARKHLQRLAALCASSCEEYRHLDSAIAVYAKKSP
jgi:tetratricopeptide (TPR) repeat protein